LYTDPSNIDVDVDVGNIVMATPAGRIEVFEFVCESCETLFLCSNSNVPRTLSKIVQRVENLEVVESRMKSQYLTYDQFALKCRMNRSHKMMDMLIMWKMRVKFDRLNQYRTDSARMMQMLAAENLPRVKYFLQCLVNKNASSTTIIKVISKVVSQDMTRCRHHKLSADEIDASDLYLMFGGSKLLHGLATSHGFGGVKQLKGLRDDDSRFGFSWDHVRDETVLLDLTNFFVKRKLPTDHLVIHDIIFDGVNVEERARPSSTHNIVKGYTRESNFQGMSLSGTSYAQLSGMKNTGKIW